MARELHIHQLTISGLAVVGRGLLPVVRLHEYHGCFDQTAYMDSV